MQVWREFCERAGVKASRFDVLHQGLSYRTYQRVFTEDGDTHVLMCVPVDRPLEDGQSAVDGVILPFLKVQNLLNHAGLRVPTVRLVDEVLGLVLLEDLGERTFYDAFHVKGADMAWYDAAVDVLSLLVEMGDACDLPRYDMSLATIRGDFFLDDYVPAVRGGMPSSRHEYTELREILADLYKRVASGAWGVSLWDFHSPNLLLSGGAPSVDAVGVIDFQDAKIVPVGYDLASMAFDARYYITEQQREAMILKFVEQNPQLDRARARENVYILSALRNLGILGRFARGAFRDGRTEFLDKIPLIWRYLDEAVAVCPALQPLDDFLKHALPEGRVLHRAE